MRADLPTPLENAKTTKLPTPLENAERIRTLERVVETLLARVAALEMKHNPGAAWAPTEPGAGVEERGR